MHATFSLTSTLLLAVGALAQYGSGSYGSGSSGSSGSSAAAPVASSADMANAAVPSGKVMVHVVKVSNKKGDLTFEPNNLQAMPGSMVQFHFYPKNHSVVQSTFDQPCQPIKNNMPAVNGFFSGFMPVKADAAMMPSYTILVNDTKPIWYYCSQSDHCQDGMVGVINPPAANQSRTIDSFMSLAKEATDSLSPGESTSSSGSSYGDSGSSSGSTAPVASGSASSNTFTMPLAGTNSSTTTSPSASASAGGTSPVPFAGAGNHFAARLGTFQSVGLAGLVGSAIALFL